MLVQLQYVRAIAALMVVYFHAVLQSEKVFDDPALSHALFGETGVDLFFVLSGFVMWLTTADRSTDTVEFYKRRIERIVPLYWVFTLMAAMIALIAPSLLKSTVFDLPHLMASLFFIPWFNPADPAGTMIAPVIVPGWTLNYEMYFYLVFGALLLLPQGKRIPMLLLVIGGIFAAAQLAPDGSIIAGFYGYSVVFEFLAGVVLARLYMDGKLLPERLAAALAVTAFIGLIVLDHQKIEIPRALGPGVASTLIIYALISIDFTKYREWRFLHVLGDASYSLYITHIYVLAGARVLFSFEVFDGIRTEPVFLVFCLVASVVFALLVHFFFEKPVAEFFKRRRQRHRQKPSLVSG
ncbi:acyltransferase family protein [Roseibium sp.]|uniref:acyltransferase family protein n=1 Tax=Roseibium sp. TaxID=1936156 RepID=UPI003A97FABD